MKRRFFILLFLSVLINQQQLIFAGYTPFDSFIPLNDDFGYSQNMFKVSDVFSGILETPEDMAISEGLIYVADSEIKAVVVVSLDGEVIEHIGEGILNTPMGVFADKKYVYVADSTNETVYKFDKAGKLVKQYTKPNNPLFGKHEKFVPTDVVADASENLYIVSHGGTNGIIQMNEEGEFLGYFGVNTSQVTFKMMVQRFIYSTGSGSPFLAVKPPSPDRLTIDSNGLLYTLTSNDTYDQRVKKLNIAGKNVFQTYFSKETYVDLTVDKDGNVFYLSSDHWFGFYDSFGNFINSNILQDTTTERYGVFKQPSAIAIDDNDNLYISDAEKGQIVKLKPTEIAALILSGIHLYREGLYLESMDIWKDVLSLNSNFAIAHNALAKAYYKQEEYDKALGEYMLSGDRVGYSNAYWQARNIWLQSNLGTIIIILVVLLVIKKILDFADKKKNIYDVFRNFSKWFKNTGLYKQMYPMFSILRSPVGTSEYIKLSGNLNIFGYIPIFIAFVVGQVLFHYAKGYSFTYFFYRSKIDIFTIVVMLVVPYFLFVVSNYLVSTITDGEGSFSNILFGAMYSFAPLFLFALPLSIFTNYLTINEAFLFDFAMMVIYLWSFINLFVVTMNLHDYTFLEAVKNIFLTLVGMVLLLIVALIFYVLIDQFIMFVVSFR